ncbi:MAG: hypothetical protein IKE41_01895 [Clostridia bacterium]|nr:hypothetical protein [Clostridia bacterium]
MKKELTIEQKAKRYDYFEKVLIEFLERRIDDSKYNESEHDTNDYLQDWISQIDDSDLLPDGVYMLLDKILDENYGCFVSMKNTFFEYLKNRYFKFEKEIGEKNDRTNK